MIDYRIIPLGELLSKEYTEQKIEAAFKKFSCQREADLENFLLHRAIPYEKANHGKTYVFIDVNELKKESFDIIAYFTLAHNALDISVISKKKKRKLLGEYPGRDSLNSVPTFLIGQLGRCDKYIGNDLTGELILNEAYHAISVAAKVIGGNLVVLECREQMFSKFYEGQGFQKLYDELDSKKLYTLYKKIDFTEYWNH